MTINTHTHGQGSGGVCVLKPRCITAVEAGGLTAATVSMSNTLVQYLQALAFPYLV